MDLRDDDEEDEDEEGAQRKYLDVPSRNPAADISVSSAGFPSNMSNISSGLDLEEDTKRRSKARICDGVLEALCYVIKSRNIYPCVKMRC